jgi:branched-chain amino acid transport system substrate-binding protein
VSNLLSQGVGAIVGAASSSVTRTVINQITGAGVVQMSPANTGTDLTTWDDNGLYWRTAPSDVLQGRVLGNYIASCGVQTLGMIVLNDAYGTSLQKTVTEAFEGAGGKVVAAELYNTGDSQFSTQVDNVLAAKPDAIAVISFDEAKQILPLLTGKGIKGNQLFLVDGNTLDYSKDFQPGTLTGAHGTQPGTFAKADFQAALKEIDPALKDYNYAGESYDAVNLIALAAEAAESVQGTEIAQELKAVSEGGEKCTGFASCVTLLREGKDIDYDGYSGPIAFTDAGDPSEAFIGIYEFGEDNKNKPIKSEFGKLG